MSSVHPLWEPIPTPQREVIRSMLNHLNLEILKRARPDPRSTFNFSSASIGNLFLTGARLFMGSFEAAIYLLGVIGGVSESVAVIPVINSNFSHHISARLENSDKITGQNAISHPSAPTAMPAANDTTDVGMDEAEDDDDDDQAGDIEDANLPGSLPTLRRPNIEFSKSEDEDLPARIERIGYINPYGQGIRPNANPKVIEAIHSAEAVVYSIGSLYTSIMPSLVLRGVGAALANAEGLKYKILILNGNLDRETGPKNNPMGATDFVKAISKAAQESQSKSQSQIAQRAAKNHGVFSGGGNTDACRHYVTHVIHLEGTGTPKVDREVLADWGIDCVRLYGRKGDDGKMRYDGKALTQALQAIVGKGDTRKDRSRRNTLER